MLIGQLSDLPLATVFHTRLSSSNFLLYDSFLTHAAEVVK